MKLTPDDLAEFITEDPDIPGPGTLTQQADELGDGDPAATNQIRKGLEQQAKVKKKESEQPQRKMRTALQQLSATEWDPENSKFQRLAGQVMAGPAGLASKDQGQK